MELSRDVPGLRHGGLVKSFMKGWGWLVEPVPRARQEDEGCSPTPAIDGAAADHRRARHGAIADSIISILCRLRLSVTSTLSRKRHLNFAFQIPLQHHLGRHLVATGLASFAGKPGFHK